MTPLPPVSLFSKREQRRRREEVGKEIEGEERKKEREKREREVLGIVANFERSNPMPGYVSSNALTTDPP